MRIPTAFGLVCVVFLYSTVVDAKLPPQTEWPKLIEDSFKALDADGDGKLTAAEWYKLLENGDTNNDACLSLEEFLSVSQISPEASKSIYGAWDSKGNNCVQKEKLTELFGIMDRMAQGYVTKLQFKQAYNKMLWMIKLKELLG